MPSKTLALGIGATTAMFQLLDAVRLRDLPVEAPARLRLVRIAGDGPSGNFTARYSDLSTAQWQQLEARPQVFSTIAVWSPRQFNLADGGVVRRAEGMFVSGDFFEMLGVSAARGRVLAPADDRPACGSPSADAPAEDAQRYTAMWLHSVPAAKGLSWLRIEYERSLWLLLGSAALMLLIVCGNLANLLLARGGARAEEITVRLALGASRGHVIRQLLTESVVIASAGAALGLALAGGVSRALVSMLVTANDPVALPVGLDWRAAAFSFAVATVTCAAFGLRPALRTAKAMRPGGRGVVSHPGRSVLARALVVSQVAFGFVLVAGALLFGRSLHNLLTASLGFQPEPVMIASVDTRRLGFDEDRRKELYRVLLDQVRAAPGVLAAAQSNIVPMSGWESNTTLVMGDGRSAATRMSGVSSGYFQALGVPLLAGRDFDSRDGEHDETVAIVNDAFVRRSTQVDSASTYARFVVRSARPWAEAGDALRASIASVSPSIDVRRQEIGIRMALGADPAGITGLVVHEARSLLMLGAAGGLVMTLIAGRAATGLLYGLRPADPLNLAATLVVLFAIGLMAAYVPARRAAAIDPVSTIRRE